MPRDTSHLFLLGVLLSFAFGVFVGIVLMALGEKGWV